MSAPETISQPRPAWQRALMILVRSILAIYVGLILAIVFYEGKLVFPAPTEYVRLSPADSGLAFEDLHIPVNATSSLHAWWVPAEASTSRTILYFHGNAEVLEEEEASGTVKLFHQLGVNLLLVDYRGFGGSSKLQTTGTTTAEDARAAMRYLTEQRHIPASATVLFGRSIGTGVATQLATETQDAAGLILLSPITSSADVGNQQWLFRYPFRPVEWLRHDNDFNNAQKIRGLRVPLLILSGSEDTLAPPWMSRELYSRASSPKTLVVLDHADHNDTLDAPHSTVLQAAVRAFLGTQNPKP